MPGLRYDNWGIGIRRPFIAGERGAEPLTGYPRRIAAET